MAKLDTLTNATLADTTRADLTKRGYLPVIADEIPFIDEMTHRMDHPKPQPHSPIQLTKPNGPIILTGTPRRG